MNSIEIDILVDAITLLIHVNDNKSQKLVIELLDCINTAYRIDQEVRLIRMYKQIICEIIDQRLTIDRNPTELSLILVRFKSDPVVFQNEDIFDRLQEIFSSNSRINENTLVYISDKLKTTLISYKCGQQIKRMFGHHSKAMESNNIDTRRELLNNILNCARDIDVTFNEIQSDTTAGLVEHIDFTNKQSLLDAARRHEDRKVAHTLKLGLQGLNRMFSEDGTKGPSLGESVFFPALSHHYKSGILLDIPKWIVKYNQPPVHPEGKKPLVLHYSLENEAFSNMYTLYKNIYENTTKRSADGKSNEYIVSYVYDYFNQNGYTFITQQYLPSVFGYEELTRSITQWENSGYFIVAICIDYMNNMRKSSDASKVGNYLLVKELCANVCAYTKSKGITLFSAHQFNAEAQKLGRDQTNVVKKFDSAMLGHSTDVFREVDTVINQHIERNLVGEIFLTHYLIKRRYHVVPESRRYSAYQFTQWGIPDDVHGDNMSIKNVYATEKARNAKDNSVFDLESMLATAA